MKISFFTLGCKLNQAETDELQKNLKKQGHVVVSYDSREDICIVRGCGVTCSASQKTRNIIHHAKRRGAYVVAVGCVEDTELAEIDFVAKSNKKITEHLKSKFGTNISGADETNELSKTRALVKIQTGCNFSCAYCLIPSFRGKSNSLPAEKTLTKINQAVKAGYKEITLTGVNICQYTHKNNITLVDLLEMILKQTKIQRIRLGSLDPRLISNKLIELYQSQLKIRLLPHWHLSLQSGSDTVLKRMKRNYTAKKYYEITKKLRQTYPLFSFTTDIIIGFPGETEKEFAETCKFVKKIGFAKVHIFPFSPRPGTQAIKLPNQIDDKIKKERVKKLTKIATETAKKYEKQFIGLSRSVLFEHQTKPGWCEGYTPEYLKVKIKSHRNLYNQIKKIKII